jgi:D-threonate/D-erythronate kinase
LIAIIADDFTGAAELAGISLRYGLTVKLYLGELKETNADVVVVCTDSRSLNAEQAKKRTAIAIENIIALKPSLLYKKIDSVLRGYVLEELKEQLQITGKNKALILPANPSLGRTIRNGEYYIDGEKITETGFVHDPEFPIQSSWVKEMIGDQAIDVVKYSNPLPEQGIIIGEAISGEDYKNWASLIDSSWMLAGAGDFYTVILDNKYQSRPEPMVQLESPHLYVCGTAFKERKELIKKLDQELNCVSYLPGTIDEDWLRETGDIIMKQNRLVIAINETHADALELRTKMASAVKQIIEQGTIKELFIEGGSTAAAILQELNIKELIPVNELERGVVRMKANGLFITVKPGSYQLPVEIRNIYSANLKATL